MVRRRNVVMLVVIGIAMQASGCAWLFQDRLPSGYAGYSGRSEPQCSTGSGWAVVDGVFAGLSVIGAISAAGDDANPNQGALVWSSVGWAVIHTASAMTGARWAGECRKAHATWNSETTAAEPAPRATARAREEHPDPALIATPPVAPPMPPRMEPRGFYCAVSPSAVTAALCTRDKASCVEARSAILGVVPDLGACTLVETAFCFDAGSGNELERCTPSEPSCVGQREAVGTSASACIEQR